MGDKGEKLAESPGCMTLPQISALKNALKIAGNDPSLLCDLEGCGPVFELEREFALICGTRFALAVSSGTAAIHAALLASGIGPGDEVIVTPYSWPQSVAPVIFSGATPVFADIDPLTLNLDTESVLGRISSRTRAILPVHLFGHPADMVRLEKLAGEIGAVLISDAAHALGARLDSRSIGAWGDISCFSLGRGKLVSGGEGGIITTDDEVLYEKAVAMTQHPERLNRVKGQCEFSEEFGLNFRIHPLAAILALCDLRDIKKKKTHRKEVLVAFSDGLGKQDVFSFQAVLDDEELVAYGIPLSFVKDEGRKRLVSILQGRGVPLRCGPVVIPLHFRLNKGRGPLSPFHCSQKKGACPMAEKRCKSQELWVLSALDMDGISTKEAYDMGVIIRSEAERLFDISLGSDIIEY